MDFTKFDPTLLLMGAVLVVLIIFMVRNSRKRRRDAAEMQDKVKVGAEVMTNFGLYAHIKKIDAVENKVVLETSPGHTLTVHRQVIARVVEPDTSAPTKGEAVGKAVTEVALNPEKESGNLAIDPQFGERVAKPATKSSAKPAAKRAPRSTGNSSK